MAKTIGISDDSGVSYSIFPGSSGDLATEGENIDDGIYGNKFASGEIGLLSWSLSTNAIYKGSVGYGTTLKKTGTSTAMTGEPLELISGKEYKTTAATKNIWDRTATFVIYDGVTDVTDQVETWDYLYGRVTFLAAYTVVGAITADGNYLPTSDYGSAREYTLTQNADTKPLTSFTIAQGNGGYTESGSSTKNVSLSLSGFYALSNGFKVLLASRGEIIIEIAPEGDVTGSTCRGFFKMSSTSQSGDFGGSEDESVDFVLSSPSSDIVPFKWDHPSTSTIPEAIKKALVSWEDELTYKYQYLEDGAVGSEGEGILTDVSLSGGLSSMNEYSIAVNGSGPLTPVV